MIGLATNGLVRYLTQVDPDQAATANRLAGCTRTFTLDRKLAQQPQAHRPEG